MKKYTLLLLVSLLISSASLACDACGCRLGGLSYGILPQHYQHLVGIRYSHAAFHAEMNHDSQYLGHEYSNDTYQRMDLIGRISVKPWLKLNVQLPYLINHMEGNHEQAHTAGPGDPMVMAYFTPFNTGNTENKWKNALLLGVGAKLPVGNFEEKNDGVIINRNFQLGSGSTDLLLSANYTVSVNNWGLNTETSYKLNSANKNDYQFGNQFNLSGYFFRYLERGSIGWLPYAGAYYEQSAPHYDGLVRQINTGGHALLSTVGSQLYWKQVSLTADYQHPLVQRYNAEDIATITAKGRWTIGLLYSLQRRKKSDS